MTQTAILNPKNKYVLPAALFPRNFYLLYVVKICRKNLQKLVGNPLGNFIWNFKLTVGATVHQEANRLIFPRPNDAEGSVTS